MQLHWDDWSVPGWLDAARWLADCQAAGLVKHIGVTNFDVAHLIKLREAGVKVASNQARAPPALPRAPDPVRCCGPHPLGCSPPLALTPPSPNKTRKPHTKKNNKQVAYSVVDRRPGLLMTAYCKRHGIALLPYGVLAGGWLSDKYVGTPASAARVDTVSKSKYGTLLREVGGWAWLQRLLDALRAVARRKRVSVAAVAARWVLQQPQVSAVIIGARNARHLRDAQRLFTFELDEADLLDLDAVYEEAQQPTSDVFAWERGGRW
jgi:aryl-alcohol dehydrogenase-like predicted oxidoreductase